MSYRNAFIVAAATLLLFGCSKKYTQMEAVSEPVSMSVSTEALEIDLIRDEAPSPNPRRSAAASPLSTFSVDVDTGSYALARRDLREGRLPMPERVRTEEFLNYFDYGYPEPAPSGPPVSLTTEIAAAPWDPRKLLLQVGLQSRRMDARDLPPANLVFLIDTSGSMDEADRLPLLKEAFRVMTAGLRPADRVAIVAYAGSAGLVLPSTPGNERARIVDALDALDAGGGTDGGQGIALAYQVAKANFIRGGTNRVILATDGDFNLGTSSVDELKAMLATQRASGIALSTLGFGTGNYHDQMAEQLADVGDGNHAYIDDALEARKVLARELGATLHTIAADVKIQLEFNPALVAEYRLLGYENRALADEQFRDDRADAGEIGSGHDVTALYEVILAGSGAEQLTPPAQPVVTGYAFGPDALAEVRVRFARPGQGQAEEIVRPILRSDIAGKPSARFAFAAGVAAFAERLRGSDELGDYGYAAIAQSLTEAVLPDPHGERAELADLAALAETAASN